MVLWDWSRGNEITQCVESVDVTNGKRHISYRFANGQSVNVISQMSLLDLAEAHLMRLANE